jgi:hypothetical protein
VQPVSKVATKPFVAIGCRTEPVIEVRKSGKGELAVFGEVTQQEQQCDGIGSARNGDEHMAAWWA